MGRTWRTQGRTKIGILIENVIFVEYPEGNILVGTPTYKRENKESWVEFKASLPISCSVPSFVYLAHIFGHFLSPTLLQRTLLTPRIACNRAVVQVSTSAVGKLAGPKSPLTCQRNTACFCRMYRPMLNIGPTKSVLVNYEKASSRRFIRTGRWHVLN